MPARAITASAPPTAAPVSAALDVLSDAFEDAAAAAEKRYPGQRTDQHRNGVYPARIDRSAALPHHDGHQTERYSSGEPERLARYYRAGAHANHDQE